MAPAKKDTEEKASGKFVVRENGESRAPETMGAPVYQFGTVAKAKDGEVFTPEPLARTFLDKKEAESVCKQANSGELARDEDGQFVADDESTPEDEHYEAGVEPPESED